MNNIPLVFWLIPIASIVALGMAWYFFRSMMNEDEGTDRMREISGLAGFFGMKTATYASPPLPLP